MLNNMPVSGHGSNDLTTDDRNKWAEKELLGCINSSCLRFEVRYRASHLLHEGNLQIPLIAKFRNERKKCEAFLAELQTYIDECARDFRCDCPFSAGSNLNAA